MEDNKDMEQQPKKRGRKPKVENKIEDKVEKNQAMDFMNMMTPEMMQMFMKFMESQQKTEVMTTSVTEEKPIKWSKAMLNKIKDEMVDVRSVMDGKVIYVSPKTHIKYKWLEKGDIEQLTIEEILAMDTKKMFLRTPLLVVEDERVVEALGLKGINKLVNKVEDIDQLVEGVYRDKMDRANFHKRFLTFGIALYLLVMLTQTLLGVENYISMLNKIYVVIILHLIIVVNSYFLLI